MVVSMSALPRGSTTLPKIVAVLLGYFSAELMRFWVTG